MVNPIDAAPDTLQPRLDQPEIAAPPDHEAIALESGIDSVVPVDEHDKDDTALADLPDARPDDDSTRRVEPELRRPEPRVAHDLGMQAIGRQQPAEAAPAPDEHDQADERHNGARRDTYQLAIHRVGTNAVGASTEVEATREEPDVAQLGDDDGERHQGEGDAVNTPDGTAAGTDNEPVPAADAGLPPRPPDNPGPPVGGSGFEEEPEDQDESRDGSDQAADRPEERPAQPEVTAASDTGKEAARAVETVYSTERVAHLFGMSYGGVRDVQRRSESLLYFQNAPEPTGQRITNFPAPYINALKEYQQQNGITSFKKAADGFASTLEGQSLAHGLRAEYEDRIREFAKAQRGYLTPAQAGELMNVGSAYLLQHGLVTDVPPNDQQSGRIDSFVRPRGVSAETVRRTMDWTHTAFTDPIPVPEVPFYASSDAERVLGCSRRAVIQMTSHGYIPNWRFESESGASNRKYPQEYVDALGEHLRTHNKLDLIDAAEQFAREHSQAHTLIRGQFELGLHRLAKEGNGHIPREQLAEYLHLQQGQFWRVLGPKPDGRGGRGYPLDYVHDRIAWSGAEIKDREHATVDARGRVRWQVGTPGIKGQILGEVAEGNVPTDVAKRHGIPPRTVLGWVETDRRKAESQRARQPGITKEQVARTFERRLEQQEVEVSAASEGMGAETARQIIVDSRPTARQFARWVADNEQSLMRVAAIREGVDQSQIAAQIELARLLSEQHRIYPADVLMCAKVFEDLRPFVQAVPVKPDENPEDRPVMSARQLAAFRLATDLARKGRLSYFPEAGV